MDPILDLFTGIVSAERLTGTLITFVTLLAELAVLFLGVSFAVELVNRRIGQARLRRLLGGNRLTGALKGLLLGALTPFCTYSAIPMLVNLVRAKVSTASIAAFLLAAPVLDPFLAAALILLFSPTVAAIYIVVVTVGVLLAALVAEALDLGEHFCVPETEAIGREQTHEGLPADSHGPSDIAPSTTVPEGIGRTEQDLLTKRSAQEGVSCEAPEHPPAAACDSPGSAQDAWQGWRPETQRAFWSSLQLGRSMAVPLVVAVAFAALIAGYLPQEVVLALAGPDQPMAVPLAAALGAPFYVSIEALIPIGAALSEKGMGLGAVFALTVAGAGMNVPEFVLLAKLMTRRALAWLIGSVGAVAVAGGYLVNLL